MDSEKCISCGSSIRFRQEARLGDIVKCSSCGTELEVVWLDPIELDWPHIDDEYDSDDFYDDED